MNKISTSKYGSLIANVWASGGFFLMPNQHIFSYMYIVYINQQEFC